jgi:hypothetical protein
MSFETLVWVRSVVAGNPSARSVLRVIADHAGQDHSCYLRTSLIAGETELSESTVRSALAHLAENGLVKIYERRHPNGARRSNRYQALVEGDATPEPDAEDWADVRGRKAAGDPPGTGGGTLREPEGGAPGAGGGTLREPEGLPLIEVTPLEATPVKGRASRSKTATRVPDDFTPTDDMKAWFATEKLHEAIIGRIEHEKFMDYWRAVPGAKGRKLDWPATWRNWMRTAADRSGRRPVSAPPGTGLIPASGAVPFPSAGAYRPSTTDQKVAQTLELGRRLQAMEDSK